MVECSALVMEWLQSWFYHDKCQVDEDLAAFHDVIVVNHVVTLLAQRTNHLAGALCKLGLILA